MWTFYVTKNITTIYLGALLCGDFDEFSAETCGYGLYCAPRSLDVAEHLALGIFLTDERFDARCALAVAAELVVYLSLYGCYYRVCLGVLEGCHLFRCE